MGVEVDFGLNRELCVILKQFRMDGGGFREMRFGVRCVDGTHPQVLEKDNDFQNVNYPPLLYRDIKHKVAFPAFLQLEYRIFCQVKTLDKSMILDSVKRKCLTLLIVQFGIIYRTTIYRASI